MNVITKWINKNLNVIHREKEREESNSKVPIDMVPSRETCSCAALLLPNWHYTFPFLTRRPSRSSLSLPPTTFFSSPSYASFCCAPKVRLSYRTLSVYFHFVAPQKTKSLRFQLPHPRLSLLPLSLSLSVVHLPPTFIYITDTFSGFICGRRDKVRPLCL